MKRFWSHLMIFMIFPVTVFILTSGCSTTRSSRAAVAQNPQQKIAELEGQLQAKDQEIRDLQDQIDSRSQALPESNFSSTDSADPKNILRVAGVSEIALQKALSRAGFDPGPLDGRLGKKTRSAIKAFQRRRNLTADGVVGEKTWAALRTE